jgi:hypothetical protein
MGREPQAPREPTAERDSAIAVISAYGAFRVLLVLLAVWTFFAGFSLLVQGPTTLTFGSDDPAAERIIGALLIVLVPVYGLLAWRREEYRLLSWIPYAAQAAVILPSVWDIVVTRDRAFQDAALMVIVSGIFLVLLVYFWWSSHPLGFFQPEEEPEAEEDFEAGDEEDVDEDEEPTDDEYEDEEETVDDEGEYDEEDYEDEEEDEEEPPPPPRRRR